MCAMEHFKIIMFQFLTTQQVHFKIYPTFFFFFTLGFYIPREVQENEYKAVHSVIIMKMNSTRIL